MNGAEGEPRMSELEKIRELAAGMEEDAGAGALRRILRIAAMQRKREIDAEVHARFGGVVQGGPFVGLWLPHEVVWGCGDFSSELLGVYEEELHGEVEKVIARGYPTVIDVGCAEGYYAVGLARRMPETRVVAFDVNPDAQRVCAEAARANGVADRVEVRGACDRAALLEAVRAGRQRGEVVLLVDCEGAEAELLDPAAMPELVGCDLLIECHDLLDRSISPTLRTRFSSTHHVETVIEGPRDPNRFDFLQSYSSLDRALALCEFRGEMMRWLVCRRRHA